MTSKSARSSFSYRKKPPNSLSTLLPDITLRILFLLPVSSLVRLRCVSRRFKILVQHDEIWSKKLLKMGIVKKIDGWYLPSYGYMKQIMIPLFLYSCSTHEKGVWLWLPPPLDDSQKIVKRRDNLGSFDLFRLIYAELAGYYLDFRKRANRDFKIFRDFEHDPMKCSNLLAQLKRLALAQVVDDYKQVGMTLDSAISFFESNALQQFEDAYDRQDTAVMKCYAGVLIQLSGGHSCVQVFIQKHTLFYDNRHDPLDNLYSIDSPHDEASMELSFSALQEFEAYIEKELQVQSMMVKDVFGENAMSVLNAFAERLYEDVLTEYVQKLADKAFLLPNSKIYFESVSRCFKSFRKITAFITKLEPIRLEEHSANMLLYQAFASVTDGLMNESFKYVKRAYEQEMKRWEDQLKQLQHERQKRISAENRDKYKKSLMERLRQRMRSKSDASSSLEPSSSKPPKNQEDKELELVKMRELSTLLSLELALNMIYVNKVVIQRCINFVRLGGRAGADVERGMEQIFAFLLQSLMQKHIKPAFEAATKKLATYKPTLQTTRYDEVQPLLNFFELVHVADLMQQMVHVYYKEQICRFVDEHDFMNTCNSEKKAFERALDDLVAIGLDKSMVVLMDQIELILQKEQLLTDYDPKTLVDLQPTKACLETVKCLTFHTTLIIGATDKHTLEVFYMELGLRFFGVFSKHLKRFQISETGGFRLISDLNAYYEWADSLQVSDATTYFEALKELGHIFVVSPQNLRELIHDMQRFKGVIRVEEVYEFVALRKDYQHIRKMVDERCSFM